MLDLLDPRNDFVFKKLFVRRPDLLADLINAVRSEEPPVEIVDILNPHIAPEELSGKQIVLDVLARDTQGHLFNIEMQVRGEAHWLDRSAYYLASTYVAQLKRGDHYDTLEPAIGINLLDFNLFDGSKAHWHFRFQDDNRPDVALGGLQLHVVELRKLDRQEISNTDAGTATTNAGASALTSWVAWFRHWREEHLMSEIDHPPVQMALEELKNLSQDEEIRWRAVHRDWALYAEATATIYAMKHGQSTLLNRQLTLKFGVLPVWIQLRLRQASTAELDALAERILFADTLEAVFPDNSAKLPPTAAPAS